MLLVHFWPIFPIFGAKKFFLENTALSRTTSFGFLASHQHLEKTKDKIPKNARTDRRTEGWKDGRKEGRTDRPNFIEPYRLTPGVQLHLFDNFWTFKTQNTECSYIHVENYIYKKLKEAVEIYRNQTKNHSVLAKIYKVYYMYS